MERGLIPKGLDLQVARHGRAGGAEQRVGPQVALVEELDQGLVVASLFRVRQDETIELGFAFEPRRGAL